MTTDPLIIDDGIISRFREVVAPRTDIIWDSQTNNGSMSFWVEHDIYENDVFVGRKPDTRFDMRPMNARLEELLMQEFTFTTPLGEKTLMGFEIMAAFKEVFRKAYRDKMAVELPPETLPPSSEAPEEV